MLWKIMSYFTKFKNCFKIVDSTLVKAIDANFFLKIKFVKMVISLFFFSLF